MAFSMACAVHTLKGMTMKPYRTIRLLTATALYIIGNDGNCANVECHFCPLNEKGCRVNSGRLLSQHSRKPLLIKYLVDEYGESEAKGMIMEELI
jgi:hypothetical protein